MGAISGFGSPGALWVLPNFQFPGGKPVSITCMTSSMAALQGGRGRLMSSSSNRRRRAHLLTALTLGCSLSAFAQAQTSKAPDTTVETTVTMTELPVGDGKVTGHAQVGNVYACTTTFRTGGARHVGDWIHEATWNPLEKPHVQGEVMWPEAQISIKPGRTLLNVQSNGLPVGQPTGTFPIARTDPARQYDTNPNPVAAQTLAFDIPLRPSKAAQPGCLGMGMIGFGLTGVALYNALDDAGLDPPRTRFKTSVTATRRARGSTTITALRPACPEPKAVRWWAGRSTATPFSECATRRAGC